MVLRFSRRMCKSVADADDVLQETLLQAATRLPEFEGRASLSSWLFALARSTRRASDGRRAQTGALPMRA
jgi:DNA-directed RNA polymerase specialized sigma24 family protein